MKILSLRNNRSKISFFPFKNPPGRNQPLCIVPWDGAGRQGHCWWHHSKATQFYLGKWLQRGNRNLETWLPAAPGETSPDSGFPFGAVCSVLC